MSVKIMEEKKIQKQREAINIKKATDFFGDIKTEFKKVSWTPREELVVYTKVVVIGTFLFGMLVYSADVLIQSSLSGFNIALRVITG